MDFQMRNKTFISSMVGIAAAVAVAGAANAALTAIAILALNDAALAEKLLDYRAQQTAAACAMTLPA